MSWCGKRAVSSTTSDQPRNLQRTCAASRQLVASNPVKGILSIGQNHGTQLLRGIDLADVQADTLTTHLVAYRGSGVPIQPLRQHVRGDLSASRNR